MCIIIDTNKIGGFLNAPSTPDAAPIHAWLASKKGTMVYSIGGKLGKEQKDARRKLEDYNRAGRAILINAKLIESEQIRLQKIDNHKSNDVHIIALANVSGARLLYTEDRDLMNDFRDKKIIDHPRGKIYSSARNRNLLQKGICK